MICLFVVPTVQSQSENPDTSNRFGLHLGSNFGAGFAGGTFGGGGITFSPRIGIHYKKRIMLGIEYLTDYQILYLKDTITQLSVTLTRWIGPFIRYYFFPPQKEWNILGIVNYVYGSDYAFSTDVKYRETYNTLILGIGCSYKVKKTLIEAGYRYTFLFDNTPIGVRQTNIFMLGLSRNF